MSEIQRISNQLRAAFDGSPWYGTAVWTLVNGVTAEEAQAHPVTGAHSIWEVVLHMTYWRRVTLEALAGSSIAVHQANTAEDWRSPDPTTDDAWRQAREQLRRTQDDLLAAVADLDDGLLEQIVPGRDYTFYVLLHGIVQHDIYHGGQIPLLKKACEDLPF